MSLRSPFLPFFLLLESCLLSPEFCGAACVLSNPVSGDFCTSLTCAGACDGCVVSPEDARAVLPDAAVESPLLPDAEDADVSVLPGAGWFGPGAVPEPAVADSRLSFCVPCTA